MVYTPQPPQGGSSQDIFMLSLKTIFGLASNNLKNKKVRTFLVALSVSFGVAVLFFFLSFLAGIEKFVLADLTQKMDPRQLVVSYNYKNAGLFQVEADKALRLDQALIQEIQAMEGVEKVAPQLVLKIPVSVQIDFWDKFFETDVPVYGMDFAFINVVKKTDEDFLPVVVSSRLLDVYNTTLAESTGLPRLSEEGLIDRDLEIIFGKSSFFSYKADEVQKIPAKIVALSNNVPLMGITIPLKKAEEVLTRYQKIEEADIKYSSIYLQTKDVSFNSILQKKLQEKGFQVSSLQEEQARLNQMIWYLRKLIQVAAGVVLLIALLSVSMTLLMSVIERKQEIGILRALGMQRKTVAGLVLTEGVLIGCLAYVLGMGIAFLGIKITDFFLLKMTPDVSFKPLSFFDLQFSQAVFVFFFILFFVLFAGFFPARQASRIDPLEALKG